MVLQKVNKNSIIVVAGLFKMRLDNQKVGGGNAIWSAKHKLNVVFIDDFTTPGESHLYGLPLSLCRLLRTLGPFFVL